MSGGKMALVLGLAAAAVLGLHLYSIRSTRIVERLSYDSEGRLASHVTADGQKVDFRYDQAGKLVKMAYPGRAVSLSYDGNGNLTRAEDPSGVVSAEYDQLDRLAVWHSPNGQSISYEYDPWGRPIAVTPSGGQRVEYERDVLGRVVSVYDGQGLTTLDYLPGQVVRLLPNGVRTEFHYGPDGRLQTLRHESPGGGLLADYRYKRDGRGRIVEIQEQTADGRRLLRFEYDALGRLIVFGNGSDDTTAYSYDAEGNRTSERVRGALVAYHYTSGRLDRAGGAGFAYDAAGQLRERLRDQPSRYGFDTAGRLAFVETGTRRVRYEYDAMDHRVAREVNGTRTLYLHDVASGRPLLTAEYGASGQLLSQYIVAGRPLGVRDSSDRTSYFLEDHLGSVRYVTDVAGRITSTFDYSPFGAAHAATGRGPRFAGEEWDDDANLLYLQNRYMDPRTGRFLSRDRFPPSLEDPQTFNRYVYAVNDPINLIEPLGAIARASAKLIRSSFRSPNGEVVAGLGGSSTCQRPRWPPGDGGRYCWLY